MNSIISLFFSCILVKEYCWQVVKCEATSGVKIFALSDYFEKKNILKHISCCFFFCFFCRMSKFISSWGHQILIFLLSALGNIFQSPMANKNKNPVLDLQISWYITSNEVLLKEYYNVNVFKLTFSNCTKYWALK